MSEYKDELDRADSSQRQHHEELRHQSDMMLHVEREEYNLFSMLKPTLSRDGNQWCVLFGEDLQSGIAGFGDTPHKAILAWNKAWYFDDATKYKLKKEQES